MALQTSQQKLIKLLRVQRVTFNKFLDFY